MRKDEDMIFRESQSDAGPRTRQRASKSPAEALAALMRLCARAEKSSGDALRLMRTWGVDAKAQKDVLQQLLDQRFIDDSRYAGAFVREKMRLSGWGSRKIGAALQRKGIARPLIDTALAAVDPAEDATRLRTQLRRKARTAEDVPAYRLKAKLIRYGLSLGYAYEAVLEAASELVKETDKACNDLF